MLSLFINRIIFSVNYFHFEYDKTFSITISISCWNALFIIIIVSFYFYLCSYLGPFAKLLKATIRFVMTVGPFICPSVRVKQLDSHWTDFH